MKKYLLPLLAASLFGFGLFTLYLATSLIFDLFGVRASEGNYVLFVVWANFFSSILYLFAAYGYLKRKKMDSNSFRDFNTCTNYRLHWP